MKVRYLAVAALLGALCAFGVSAAVGQQAAKKKKPFKAFYALATGKKEVSATTGKKGAGDPDGRAGFTAVIDGTEFCWGYGAKNVGGTPSGAHIHKARPSENGPIVIPLDVPSSTDPGAASGCETIGEELARAISKNPRKYYFNLHSTPDFPGGAVRGQLFGKRR
jgi:hypothetical protein